MGLLGGSFNPAHAGHRHVAEAALARLGLDQVWLMVSPGNPLKPEAGMAPFEDRLAGAAAIADGRRIIATGIERELGTRYTLDTLRALRRRYPRTRFVWIMGADNLLQLPRWRGWRAIARTMPFAVVPRPSYTLRALGGPAARALAPLRRRNGAARHLAAPGPPGWVFLPVAEDASSATAIREGGGRSSPGK